MKTTPAGLKLDNARSMKRNEDPQTSPRAKNPGSQRRSLFMGLIVGSISPAA
jgi:hypothetical protein